MPLRGPARWEQCLTRVCWEHCSANHEDKGETAQR